MAEKNPLHLDLEIPKPTKIDAQLEECRRAYEAGVTGAVLPALELCRKVAMPDWLYLTLFSTVHNLLVNSSPGHRGRHSRWIKQQHQDVVDFLAQRAVYELHHKGVRGDQAYEEAATILGQDFSNIAHWSFDTVRNGCLRYRRRIKENRYAYFMARTMISTSYDLISHYLMDLVLHPSPTFRPEDVSLAITQRPHMELPLEWLTGPKTYERKSRHRATKTK